MSFHFSIYFFKTFKILEKIKYAVLFIEHSEDADIRDFHLSSKSDLYSGGRNGLSYLSYVLNGNLNFVDVFVTY